HERVFLLDVVDDCEVELVAADTDRHARDDAAQGDHGDLGGATADVDDHVAGRLVHGEPGADRGGHGLLDDVNLARPGRVPRVLDRALLDAGDARGHADNQAGLGEV